jgi:hypothetical protein
MLAALLLAQALTTTGNTIECLGTEVFADRKTLREGLLRLQATLACGYYVPSGNLSVQQQR